jgi:mRNA-degrading endonuclease RelE of RelBE toxin-antitoxin system
VIERRAIAISPEDAAYIAALHPERKKRVRAALRHIAEHPEAGKLLGLELKGLRSLAVKPLRIVYEERSRRITLIGIGPREDIYKILTETVGKKA